MPNLVYAETFTLQGWSGITSGVIDAIGIQVKSRGYSMTDVGEVYIRRTEGGLHINFKVYDGSGKEEIDGSHPG